MKQTLKYIYDKLVELVKISEDKYAITLALSSAVIVLGSSFVGNENVYVKILASGTGVFSLISIICGFFALFAREIKLKKYKKIKNYKNLLYYKTIIKFDEFQYIEEIKKKYNFPNSYKPDEFDFDLARSVIAQAKVTNIKLSNFNLSIFFLMLAVLFATVMIIMLGGIL